MTLALMNLLLERLGDGLALTVVGMGVVFVSLTILMLMIGAMNKALALREGKPAAGAAEATGAPAAAAGPAGGVSPRVAAVIGAAVAAALGTGARVHRVRFVEQGGRGQWTVLGRAGIAGSHRPHLHRGPRPRNT